MATTTHRTAATTPQTRPAPSTGPPSAPAAWPWLLPLGAVLLLVLVYPVIEIVRLSFTDASLVTGEPYRVTADTYASLLQGTDFRHTLQVTFLFVLFSVVFQLLLGLAVALVMHGAERRGLRGVVATRAVVLTAWAIPGVIIGVIWSLLYQETESGILNHGLSVLGFSGTTPFLSDPDLALVSVIAANIWRGTALSMILCYAGLKTVPDEVYEAAQLDGASRLQTLLRVTLPLMLPILTMNLVLATVETFNSFDMVLSLTGGGPGTATQVLALDVYDQIFRQLNLGRGAAMAVVLMLVNVVVIALYLRLVQRQERST
ncbi:sugar ABC transporter permease [Streptomyces sp. DSM 42041]|uniref:Sugar ABC transporter permease n=1 Tax=Streptomyces hazeniae TaxID=3075538 RepID=A0ABU2NZU0_9ACTN|nr:sugar ABC transporter permease [Streptomyces sp. DSM 42041]MDT0382511.1 sugar ABC transporter permease [Streptomyces sp. DSM 42041]